MDDRRNSCSPRRVCDAAALGANASLQDGEPMCVHPSREAHGGTDRLNSAGRRVERCTLTPQVVHQRHMPKEPAKFHIPRKSKEKRELFQCVSTESREYEDMMTILTSSYIDTSSVGCFTYCNPRLVYSELLEKEFVEKRREMKADGRTEKELEESFCFLLADSFRLTSLCERGLFVGHSRSSVMGNPSKGVYLSRYSDLLQLSPFTPGATGEILVFKVMKGKVKSIYENMKNALDPTPRFDSHLSKNASKVTSLSSYRAFELTQQYFYEYSFDELRQRPRQVCPYAVVSFQFKGKDAAPSKPLAPVRLNSQSAEDSKERALFTVWTGDLVKADEVLLRISLRSFSPPLLPHKLPEKLEIGCVMRLKVVTKRLPSDLFAYNTYSGSQEVVKNGHCCSLLEVTDRNRSATSVTKLLHELETKRVVLVTPLTERGFLFLLSSVQMATPAERGVNWRRCLQALFVFPETRDVSRCASSCASASRDASQSLLSGSPIMPSLNKFIPALHHALVKACANPSPELSAGVENHAREYLMGQIDGKARQYPMGEYDVKLDDGVKPYPAPKVPRVSQDGYLRSYLYSPAAYLLSVARAREMVAIHCGPEVTSRRGSGRGRESIGKMVTSNSRDGENTQNMQQLFDLVVTCKRNAEIEVNREEGQQGAHVGPGRKRKMEQKMAERALKFLKASQDPGGHKKIPVESSRHSYPGPLASVIDSGGLKDLDLLDDGSELATKLVNLLRGLNQAARGTDAQRPCELQQGDQLDSCPFDRLATKLGLSTNSDTDLRKQEELEEQTAGSISSLEGFSPSGETSCHVPTGKELCRRSGGYIDQKEEIPWVLIPITGLSTERYTQRDKNSPQDPRFHQLTMATSITTTTDPPRKVPTQSPEASAPPSPALCPSPEPSSPPSPPLCPSPEPSSPPSASQCPSPEPSPPPSPSQCPSPEPSPPPSPSQCPSPEPSPDSSRCQSLQPNEFSSSNKNQNCANDKCLAPQTSWVFTGMSQFTEQKLAESERQYDGSSVPASIKPHTPAASETRSSTSLPPAGEELGGERKERETQMGENVTKLREEEGTVEKVDIKPKGQKCHYGETKESVGGSVLPPMCSPPAHLLSNIDSIVDKHLGDLTSDMQCLLQEEKIQYTFPQSPHCTSDRRTAALRHARPTSLVSQFSQYVSFYNPCPPVHDYVSSLHDSMNSLVQELENGSPSLQSKSKGAETDCDLASSVSSFVASIRAANAKTESDDKSAVSGEQTAAVPREGDMWWSDPTVRPPDATNVAKPPTSDATSYGPMCPSVSVHTAASCAVLHPPNTSPQSPCSTTSSSLDRTLTQYRPASDNSTTGTLNCTTEEKPVQGFQGVNCQPPEFSSVPKLSVEPPQPSEQGVSGTTPGVSDAEPSTDSVPLVPPAAALNSLISQLQPEMFNHLLEIMKDIKRNSVQFYLHATRPGEQLHKDVKEHLLQQGHVEQSPVAFMNQQGSDSKLLVIINNKDIAGHIHKIPDLASLKRQQSVMFLGIDTLDDIRNNSYNELFVSGGCIVSDDMLLNPDFINEDRVAALLMFLDQSSPENVWRWKVHCKTHKKLKEQARFRRDAAKLLDLLTAYHKRQIIEFLPYHHCDTMNHQSPDLDCLIELQARYTQYRHTIFLTEQCFEKFSTYFSCGIIVAGIEEILHDLTHLVGYYDAQDKHPLTDEMLPPQERIHNFNSGRNVQDLLQQSNFPQLTDQLVPESSYREGGLQRPHQDFEMLKMAISQLRAERQAQQQQQQQQQQQLFNSQGVESNHALPSYAESGHTTPQFGQGAPNEAAQLTPGRKAVADTLELIHLTMQAEEKEMLAAGQRRGGRLGGEEGETHTVTSVHHYTPLSNQNTAIVTRSCDHTHLTSDCKDKRDHYEDEALSKAGHAIVSSSISCPVEGDRRDTSSGTEPQGRLEGSIAAHRVAVAGAMVTELKVNPKPLGDQQPPKHQQQLTEQLHQMPSLLQRSLYSQQRWNNSLLRRPHLHYSPGVLPAPSAPLRGFHSLQGAPMWPAGLVPVPSATAAALVLGFQQTGRDLRGPGLLGGYHNPTGQGNSRHSGWQRGGGFNGM